MVTSEEECLDALLEAARRLGESPTKAQYEELGLTPASATIIRQLGGWNAAKHAAHLETTPSKGPRVGPQPDDVDLPEGESWVELSVDQRWHYRNVDRNAVRTLQRRRRLRAWVDDYKGQRGCGSCDASDPIVLDLHHRDPADKEMAVGEMITYGHGRESLLEEMAKCDVVCANCHRQLHHTTPEFGDRRWVYEYKRASEGCVECGTQEPACLEFHHVDDEKHSTVARLLADGRPLERVREEIARCELLCANCHRREHCERVPASVGYDNHK